MKPTLTDKELARVKSLTELKKNYADLAEIYNAFIDGDFLKCPKCGDIMKADTAFYHDRNYVIGKYPICKRCIQDMVEQRDKNGESHESKETVQKVLQMMDKVYDDSFYSDCIKGAEEGLKEKNRTSPFATYITAIQSLTQWKGKSWKDSEFGDSGMSVDEEEVRLNQKTIKAAKKRFGSTGYSNEDYMFLEHEYQDWITRYECNTKAQEEVFENLSIIKLLKKRAILAGDSTRDLDKQHQDWMDTGKLKPKQNSTDTLSDAQTFGTFIQKIEETRPCADIDPELEDVDKIGLLIDVFFRGHTAKMLGLKNNFSHLYEKFMERYTVHRPQYEADGDSEAIFEKVFGSKDEI